MNVWGVGLELKSNSVGANSSIKLALYMESIAEVVLCFWTIGLQFKRNFVATNSST